MVVRPRSSDLGVNTSLSGQENHAGHADCSELMWQFRNITLETEPLKPNDGCKHPFMAYSCWRMSRLGTGNSGRSSYLVEFRFSSVPAWAGRLFMAAGQWAGEYGYSPGTTGSQQPALCVRPCYPESDRRSGDGGPKACRCVYGPAPTQRHPVWYRRHRQRHDFRGSRRGAVYPV